MRKANTPSPEVTESFCLVPSTPLVQRLSILYQYTCVGLGYGAKIKWKYFWKDIRKFRLPKKLKSAEVFGKPFTNGGLLTP